MFPLLFRCSSLPSCCSPTASSSPSLVACLFGGFDAHLNFLAPTVALLLASILLLAGPLLARRLATLDFAFPSMLASILLLASIPLDSILACFDTLFLVAWILHPSMKLIALLVARSSIRYSSRYCCWLRYRRLDAAPVDDAACFVACSLILDNWILYSLRCSIRFSCLLRCRSIRSSLASIIGFWSLGSCAPR